MAKRNLLIIGVCLLLFQNFIFVINEKVQLILFIIGIVTLGIPHGAADLLVAKKNASISHKSFSKVNFLVHYLSKLVLFGIIIFTLPLIGVFLFIVFAAYHFGETDLHQVKTNSLIGKLFVFAYGLLILSTILLPNFEAIKPIIINANLGTKYHLIFSFIETNNFTILSFIGLLFFIITFIYYYSLGNTIILKDQFLIETGLLIILLFNFSLLLGFTFYFVFWHSILSLNKIVKYIKKDNFSTTRTIGIQILLFSSIAIIGILIIGATGIMFLNSYTQIIYIIFGLAVLTAPHMQIMYDMYGNIRKRN